MLALSASDFSKFTGCFSGRFVVGGRACYADRFIARDCPYTSTSSSGILFWVRSGSTFGSSTGCSEMVCSGSPARVPVIFFYAVAGVVEVRVSWDSRRSSSSSSFVYLCTGITQRFPVHGCFGDRGSYGCEYRRSPEIGCEYQ